MKRDPQLETILKQAVAKKLQDSTINIPNPQASWQNIEQTLLQEDKKARSRSMRIKRAGLVAALVLVLLFAAGIPQNTTAFTKLFQIIDGWKDDVVRIASKSPIQSEGDALTSPPNSRKVVSLEEAKKLVSFTPKLPNIPKDWGYTLTEVTVWPNGASGYSNKLRLAYEGENGNFHITEERVASSYAHLKDLSGEAEEIMIGDHLGVLASFGGNHLILDWVDGDVAIKINGNLTKSEIIAIAKSLK